MKSKFITILFGAICFGALSCKKDNYDEPKSQLSGKFHYKGEAIQVEYDRVPFDLYQSGFGKTGPISSTIAPDGTYSHVLFDGEYKLVVRSGQGPFYWPQSGAGKDTLSITVKGNTTQDIEVEPYHMIRSPQFTYASGKVTATFKIEKIITDARAKNVEKAVLFINKTQFVSETDRIGDPTTLAGSAIVDPNNITMTVNVPTISPTQNYVFARIGVKTEGVEDLIYTPVQKIQF